MTFLPPLSQASLAFAPGMHSPPPLKGRRSLHWVLDVTDPAFGYITAKIFDNASTRVSRNPVTVTKLSPSQIEEYKAADAKKKQEILEQAKQQTETGYSTKRENEPEIAERLDFFAHAHNLESQLPLLNALSEVPLLNTRVQDNRINKILVEAQKLRISREIILLDSTTAQAQQHQEVVLVPGIDAVVSGEGASQKRGRKTKNAKAYIESLPKDTPVTLKLIAEATDISISTARIAVIEYEKEGGIITRERKNTKIGIAIAYIENWPEGEPLSTRQIAEATGVSIPTAQNARRKFQKEGGIITRPARERKNTKILKAMAYIESWPKGEPLSAGKLAEVSGVSRRTAQTALKEFKDRGD